MKEENKISQAYVRIAENVDRGIVGAPRVGENLSDAFIAYLGTIYTSEEAELVQFLSMPPTFTTAEEVADASGQDVEKVKETLYPLTRKAAILYLGDSYCLPQINVLVNLHMFYPDIKREDLEAAKLYQQFFIKEGFYKSYEISVEGTPFMRAVPIDQAIHAEEKILTAEEAHALIREVETEDLALVPCPCRTRTEKLGIRECKDKNPIGTCIFMGMFAVHFMDLGLGKKVTKEQAIKYLDEMQDLGLVAATENFTDGVPSVICLCCGCCCSQVRGRTRWDNPRAILPSNFVPEASDECALCGTCVDRCFFGALSLDEDKGRAVVDPEKCIGCGVCTIACPTKALQLRRFERTTPFKTQEEFYDTITRENRKNL
ncbi:MAG: 4Fe-4S binding protein [Candidatus Lindowbacteria bacterium]|nr:4Fe-4S binding protein [Candidatus Lindowbacteria bacterium]